MNDLRIAVLRGGPSDEYATSMKTGMAVIESLKSQNYLTKDIVITKNGEWLDGGIIKSNQQSLEGIDMVFIAMHGAYAEDGEIQKLLKRKNIRFNGSSSLSSAIAFNKHLTKETLKSHGILMPQHYLITKEAIVDIDKTISLIKNSFGPEYMIKPVANGSSIGTRLVREGDSLKDNIIEAFKFFDSLLIEEFIRGKEASCAILENFRDKNIYSFPTLELVYPSHYQYFTNEARKNNDSKAVCPSRFSYEERSKIENISAEIHEILGLTQYSSSDFIVRDGNVYFLEVNTLPKLTSQSIFPKATESVGMTLNQLVNHLVVTSKV